MSRRREGETENETRRLLLTDEMSRIDFLRGEVRTVKAEAELL